MTPVDLARLFPGPGAHLPDLLTTADMPLAQLMGARLRGEVYALERGFVPIDIPETSALRARALALALPEPADSHRLCAVGASARWIRDLDVPRPLRHTFQGTQRHRTHRWSILDATVLPGAIPEERRTRIAGLWVELTEPESPTPAHSD
ncbi:hypothetical protein D9V34_09155 [Mycetocola lacteus]|uniref:AbiEi antitoxin C-terminal domain-containing protein n=1 Tax=Mycetocola lacteus TaxID=76637 RepID=A0A3L7ARC2_9MICO|nr:hypothetical protein [Mycetocola lacteus]RLP82545.1 hypothetical protein D9V34_09155 [Mycetocola lacteus]